MIRSPSELRGMGLAELETLAVEIRQKILTVCMSNGGHLGASLGAVELAIALHFCFESPDEPIVWDVGHQAYAHKLLTGRWDRFDTLRLEAGLSGFLSREESEHDVFGAGHSSTALSAALAIGWARKGTDRWTVAVVGDGGLTAGIALEALNNVRTLETGPLLLVLNDNQMSISPNVGAIPSILANGETASFFSHFGFECLGPIDGHNTSELIGALQSIRARCRGPVLLHVMTQKGKGYTPAEESPAAYHGISPVQRARVPEKTGPEAEKQPAMKSYSEEFGRVICQMAERDPKIVAVTAAMPDGTGLTEFARRFPDRFFDVGIAEPHAVTFAAGLATQGYKPVVAIYSTFLQRALDSIIHDVALQRLPVIFAVDRAGFVGADGPTHHGMFDLSYLGMIPGMTVECPAAISDIEPLFAAALESASRSVGPTAIRYPRGTGPAEFLSSAHKSVDPALRWHRLDENPVLIGVGLGSAARRACEAFERVSSQSPNVAISWVTCTRAKPVPEELVNYLDRNPAAALITVEDGVLFGGFGQTLRGSLQARVGYHRILAYGDHFAPHGTVANLEAAEGVSSEAIQKEIQQAIQKIVPWV